MEILKAVIEEEIEYALTDMLLLEDDGGDDGNSDSLDAPFSGFGGVGMGMGGGGDSKGASFAPKGGLIGTLTGIDAARGALAQFKQTGLSIGTIVASAVGTLIGGSIAAIIPFNDPAAVNFIADKMKFWESKTLKSIEEYYKKDMATVEAGWEVIKKDFWGVGFFIAPFNMLAAAATTAQGASAAASLLNVVTLGKMNSGLESVSEFLRLNDIQDPGSYHSYLENEKYEREKEKRNSSRSPLSTAAATDDSESSVEDVIRRLDRLSGAERKRYYAGLSREKKEEIKKLMAESSEPSNDEIISEAGIVQSIKNIIAPTSKVEAPKELMASIGNWKKYKPDPSPAGPRIAKIEKIIGKEATSKLLKEAITKIQAASAADEQRFINKNLPKFFVATMGPNYVQEINNLSTKYQIDPVKLANMKKPEAVSKAIDDAVAAIAKANNNVDPSKAKAAIESSKAIVIKSMQAANPAIVAPKAAAVPAPVPAAAPTAAPTAVPTAAPTAAPTASTAAPTAAPAAVRRTPNVARR